MRYYNEKIETMSRDEMTALQSARLVDVVKRTYEGAPYFREKMDAIGLKPEDIKGIEDIAKLPFTTKADLRANYPFGCFAVPKSEIARVHASSGTTGKLTVVGLTNRDIDDWAECAARALVMAGCDKDDIVHVSYGYGLFTGGLGLHYGSEKLGSVTVPASAGNTMRQITLIKDFGATALACTPSYAMVIGEGIEKAGYDIKDFKLRVGIFGAEPWSENMKKEIERKLNITAYDIYGLSEISGPGVSMSCPYQCGLHVMEDFFYPEIVDPVTLQPVPDGTTGELVFTTLNVRVRQDAGQDEARQRQNGRYAHHPRRQRLPLADRVRAHEHKGDSRLALSDHRGPRRQPRHHGDTGGARSSRLLGRSQGRGSHPPQDRARHDGQPRRGGEDNARVPRQSAALGRQDRPHHRQTQDIRRKVCW